MIKTSYFRNRAEPNQAKPNQAEMKRNKKKDPKADKTGGNVLRPVFMVRGGRNHHYRLRFYPHIAAV